ncbi:hypothetical protein C8F04DRAFT_1268988 [Mycena alexandri]|uniref:Uncharacterized protein n=1 Tax=Mycena alexandri TaxID=1745969 RepID=A0AAD6SED1_9AGAR|nr:hypothetical protein C8F04DRAFT_1268988 [Mycena alexandri]
MLNSPAHDNPQPTPPVYTGWYTDRDIPSPWSTDWRNWEGLTLFQESIDRTLIVDKLFKEVYDVPGTIQPLAYMMGISPDLHFLFFATGRYYLYDSGDLYMSDEDSRSPQQFLADTLPPDVPMPLTQVAMRPGARLDFLPELD